MTTLLFAGGGTAGHVNPLLATADRFIERNPGSEILVLGTAEGLEADLVPARGYELITIDKLPFPRRPSRYALQFPGKYRRAVQQVRATLAERNVAAVVGFGGYAAAPAYRAARSQRLPLIIHEANARPGLANRLGARWAHASGVTYRATEMPKSTLTGLPLRREITSLDRSAVRASAYEALSLTPDRPTLLVTGGSQGARSINRAVVKAVPEIVEAGWQVLHLSGGRQTDFVPAEGLHYVALEYLREMHLALAVADLAIARAGSLTVAEFGAIGIPAVYVPLPYGNGEQWLNAKDQIDAGGALLVDDAAFTPEWIRSELLPLLRDHERVAEMAARSSAASIADGDDRLCALIEEAL